jgi:hypothetical protein
MRLDSSGRLGLGTSSPGAVLDVSGSGNIVRFGDGTNTFDVRFKGPNNWAVQLDTSADKFNIQRNSSSLVTVDSSGRVGIGTSSPGTNLDVVVGSGTATQKLGSSSVAGGSYLNLHGASASKTWFIGANYNLAGVLEFTQSTANGGTTPSSTPAMVLSTAGNVGIGTTGPSSRLVVQGATNTVDSQILITATSVASAYIGANADGLNLGTDTAGIVFKTGVPGGTSVGAATGEKARIDSSGRLLVGTSSARSNFYNTSTVSPQQQIEGTTYSTSTLSIVSNNTSATGSYPSLIFGKSAGSSVGSNTAVTDGHYLGEISFQGNDGTEFVDGARITAVVDGTSGANDLPTRLVFSTTADGAASPTERFRIASTGRATFDLNNAGFYLLGLGSAAGTNALRWSSSTGLVTADTSSRLVKENIVDCPYGIDTVKALQPRKYFRTDDQRNEIGFVADEMTSVLPELVPYGPKSVITNDPDDTENIPIGVNYEKLTAVLTKALQEAIGKIETLEARLTAAGIA